MPFKKRSRVEALRPVMRPGTKPPLPCWPSIQDVPAVADFVEPPRSESGDRFLDDPDR